MKTANKYLLTRKKLKVSKVISTAGLKLYSHVSMTSTINFSHDIVALITFCQTNEIVAIHIDLMPNNIPFMVSSTTF